MNIEEITHGSLFTGLGGFDFAAQRCGIFTLWQCENNKFCKKFLDKFFPDTIKFNDIYDFDFEKAENVTIISGGFPCQDISQSGKGAGLFGPQSSKVFAQLEVISKLRPQFAVFENSPVLLVRGLEYILRCLADIGYDAQWCNISASDFGYRHKRERLFIIAYPCTSGQKMRIFRPVEAVQVYGYTPTEALLRIIGTPCHTGGNYYDLCGVHGFPRNSRKLIGAFGNAVNVTVAEYVFRCILETMKEENPQ